jgi:hypothetical protein
MRKTLACLLFLFCTVLGWGQNAYTTPYTVGNTDDTANLGIISHWKALPNGGACNLLNIGSDGVMLCQGTDGYPYQRITGATTWTKLTSLGNQMHVVMANAGITYALGPGGLDWAICQTQGSNSYSVLQWSGSAWTAKHGCYRQMAATSDGFIIGTNVSNDTWESSDGGNTYTQISGHTKGPNLTYVSASQSSEICGTDGSKVYLDTGGGFVALPAQPATSGIAGCVVTNDGINMYAWGTFGVQRWDFLAGTWNVVTGLSVNGMSAGYNPMTVAVDTAGHP